MSAESTITRIPENLSFVQPTRYTFIIPTLPYARYFCQNVKLPGAMTSSVPIETPFSKTFRHGDKMERDVLTFTFIVDEDLRVWEETYSWLEALTVPNKFTQYKKNRVKDNELYYDGILTINTNSNTPSLRIKFTYCHPISISGIDFDTKGSAADILTSTVSFQYDTFSIER
jgi:hypothetical protein